MYRQISNKVLPALTRLGIAVGWLLIVAMALPAAAQSSFIVFGDSLSDTGNLAGAITPNLPPPYFENRISDGPLAVDYFSEFLGFDARAAASGGNNYAVVGGNIVGNDFEDLMPQVSRYLHANSQLADANALYVLMLGGNDLRGIRGELDPVMAEAQLLVMVDQLMTQIARLHTAGAQQFFVVDVPDIGRIPQTLALEASDPGVGARTSVYVQRYNQLLAAALHEFAANHPVSIYDFSVYESLNEMLSQPMGFGFTQTTVACFNGEPFSPEFHPDCDNEFFPFLAPDFSAFVFFDSVHPTSKAHQIVGNAMLARAQLPALSQMTRKWSLTAILQLLLDE